MSWAPRWLNALHWPYDAGYSSYLHDLWPMCLRGPKLRTNIHRPRRCTTSRYMCFTPGSSDPVAEMLLNWFSNKPLLSILNNISRFPYCRYCRNLPLGTYKSLHCYTKVNFKSVKIWFSFHLKAGEVMKHKLIDRISPCYHTQWAMKRRGLATRKRMFV